MYLTLTCKTIYLISFKDQYTHFKASWFISPNALTAASRTSATSHLSNGTTNLYSATGEAAFAFDLSLRSVVSESGDELFHTQKKTKKNDFEYKMLCN